MRRFFTRKRLIVFGIVVAFVAAISAIGAVSRDSSTSAGTTLTQPAGSGGVPFAGWYWTMAVSKSDPDVLVLGTSSGLYRSDDAGKTWAAVGPKHLNATSLVQVGDSLYAGGVTTGATSSPIAKKGAGRSAPDGDALLASSGDDGKTWDVLHPKGLANHTVQSLAGDPADDKVLYALLNDGRLYRSTDGAGSFQLVSSKVGIPPWAIAITQGNRFVGGDMDSGAYVSTNAKAWHRTPFKDSKGGRMVMEYAVKPGDSSDVLMSSVGVLRSTDGGTTWHTALKSTTMFGPVAWAPSSGDVAYAIGFDRSLWRSEDGGKTWKQVAVT